MAESQTFHVDIVIMFLHVTNTRMMSRGERKLDCLKRESKGASDEAPTCAAVPMHAPEPSGGSRFFGVPKSIFVFFLFGAANHSHD